MFERYTEGARRALFFARLEASEIGGLALETDDVLLGLFRAGEGYLSNVFTRSDLSYAAHTDHATSAVASICPCSSV